MKHFQVLQKKKQKRFYQEFKKFRGLLSKAFYFGILDLKSPIIYA